MDFLYNFFLSMKKKLEKNIFHSIFICLESYETNANFFNVSGAYTAYFT